MPKKNLIFDKENSFLRLAVIANYQRAAQFPWCDPVHQKKRRDRKFSRDERRREKKKKIAISSIEDFFETKQPIAWIFIIDTNEISRPAFLIDPSPQVHLIRWINGKYRYYETSRNTWNLLFLFPACRNSFRLHIHWRLRSRLKFLSIFWERERERDTRIAQSCSTGELIDFRALFESSLTWKFSWNKLLFGLNTVIEHARGKRTVSQGRWYRRWMVRNGIYTEKYVCNVFEKYGGS